jgi:hypothetical protein
MLQLMLVMTAIYGSAEYQLIKYISLGWKHFFPRYTFTNSMEKVPAVFICKQFDFK